MKSCRSGLLFVVLAGAASAASASELKLTLNNGRATLIAQDVPVRQILDEWARVGKTTILNGDKVTGPPVTVQLVDRPEAEVLEVILRSASGYIAAPRDAAAPAGPSMFARVMILPVSRGPVGIAAAPTPSFLPRPNPAVQPMPMPVSDDDDDEPTQQVPPAGMPPQQPPPNPFQQQPGAQPVMPPGMQPGTPPGTQQPVLTSPRPGMLPAPPPGQPNPYGPPVVQPPIVRPGGPGGPGVEPNDDDYPDLVVRRPRS